MLQNEVNFTGSSLPGFQTQVIPQIIKPGVGVVLFHHPVIGPDGKAQGNPLLEKQGIITFYQFYREAFGKEPTGAKYEALFLMNDISTKMQRGMFLPKGSPTEAVQALRKAFQAAGKDADFARTSRRSPARSRTSSRPRRSRDLRAHPQGRSRGEAGAARVGRAGGVILIGDLSTSCPRRRASTLLVLAEARRGWPGQGCSCPMHLRPENKNERRSLGRQVQPLAAVELLPGGEILDMMRAVSISGRRCGRAQAAGSVARRSALRAR